MNASFFFLKKVFEPMESIDMTVLLCFFAKVYAEVKDWAKNVKNGPHIYITSSKILHGQNLLHQSVLEKLLMHSLFFSNLMSPNMMKSTESDMRGSRSSVYSRDSLYKQYYTVIPLQQRNIYSHVNTIEKNTIAINLTLLFFLLNGEDQFLTSQNRGSFSYAWAIFLF